MHAPADSGKSRSSRRIACEAFGVGRGRAAVGWIGVALVTTGQWLIVAEVRHGNAWNSPSAASALAVWVLGLLLVAGALGPPQLATSDPTPSEPAPVSLAAAGVALIALGLLTIVGADARPPVAAGCWIVSLVGVLIAAEPPRRRSSRWWSRRPTHAGWGALAIVAGAAVVRFVALDRHPVIVDGDGAGFVLGARRVASGELTDPFATGYLDHPTLFAFVQRVAMALAGDSLAGARAASAAAGTAAVAMTYLLARRLAGSAVGLAAAGVLAVLPVHVHFSRLALNNVFDSLTLVTALWLTMRAIDGCSRRDAAAAGVVLGLGQYFYFSARLVAVLVAGFAVWRGVEASRGVLGLRRVAGLWGWMAAGAVAAYAPLALHFLRYPATFNSRGPLVMLIGDGELARAVRADSSLTDVLAENIGRAVLSPFAATGLSTYHPDPPSVGWMWVVPLAVGLAISLRGVPRSNAVVVPAVCLIALTAVGLTHDYPMTRWVFATPVVAIATAVGLRAGWQLVRASLQHARVAGTPAVRAAALGLVAAGLAGASLVDEFTGPALARYGDVNSLIATRLAAELADEPAGTTVVGLMPPRMGLDSHHVRELVAPQVDPIDIADPIGAPAAVPDVERPAIFVALPERVAELEFVRSRYPGGTTLTRAEAGHELYTMYRVQP